MRAASIPIGLFLLAVASPAAGVAPCHDVCHLAQGQPLLLADARQLWVRRCDTPAGGNPACVVQRIDLSGKVLAQRPVPGYWDHDFEKAELAGRRVVRLDSQSAWTDLVRPYTFELAGRKVKLALEKDALVCAAPGLPVARRPLGCVPRLVQVHAAAERALGAIVVVATCTSGGDEREVVAPCEAAGDATK